MQYTTINYKKRIFEAMNFISRNIERDLSLEEIAESASFSMFHFHRIFKAVAGETVAGFTRRLRLELAANRLISKQFDDITEISVNCGFSSSQNFAKAFRQHFGMSPSEYRNSKIGNIDSKKENAFSFPNLYNYDVDINKKSLAVNAAVRDMPSYTAAYVRRIGAYSPETCQPAFMEIIQWAFPRNYLGPGKLFAIYWDNPDVTPPDKCRFDACIIVPDNTVPENHVFIQKINGGPYLVCHFELRPEEIKQAWEDAYSCLCSGGFECNDTPCYEVYHNSAAEHPEGKWIFDICIPLKQK